MSKNIKKNPRTIPLGRCALSNKQLSNMLTLPLPKLKSPMPVHTLVAIFLGLLFVCLDRKIFKALPHRTRQYGIFLSLFLPGILYYHTFQFYTRHPLFPIQVEPGNPYCSPLCCELGCFLISLVFMICLGLVAVASLLLFIGRLRNLKHQQ